MAILIRCYTDKSDSLQVPKDLNLSLPELSLDNPKVVSTIKEYINGNKDGSPRIYTMLVQREDLLTTSFQLCAINTYSELHHLTPSGYFWIADDIILVYTGLERLCKKDEVFSKKLEDIIGDRLTNDLLPDGKPNPMIFDPSTWQVRIVRDSVTVERGAMNLLGPPVVKSLKFIVPKIKDKH